MCSAARMLRQHSPSDPYRMVFVKFEEGDNQIFMHIAKQSWQIPEGTKIPVEVGFDGQWWGGAEKNNGKGNAIYAYLKPESTASFLEGMSSLPN